MPACHPAAAEKITVFSTRIVYCAAAIFKGSFYGKGDTGIRSSKKMGFAVQIGWRSLNYSVIRLLFIKKDKNM
ncbi:hypothetical protein [Chitinophaga barathri]|uniref:hypothetical protein n=1 Tax=Chitinophaga barathri TaxID=1647451 RepID=UPI000F4E7761|nr:hypothetical protein [Chitinophaga barathri]